MQVQGNYFNDRNVSNQGKIMKNWKLLATFVAVITGTSMPAHAEMELSANLGLMSDYIYRGFHQSDAVANGGVDLEAGPFYLGTWLADLDSGNGVEIDVYAGFGMEFDNGISMYAGYTAYRYTEDDEGSLEHRSGTRLVAPGGGGSVMSTSVYEYTGSGAAPATVAGVGANDDGYYELSDAEHGGLANQDDFAEVMDCVGTGFDQDYDEINLGIAYGMDDFMIGLDYAIGEHENFCGASDNDYDIAMLTMDYMGAYVTFGTYGIMEDDEGDAEGDYIEFGYATTISDLDFAIAVVDSDKDIDDETRLTFSVGYAFGL